MSAASGTGFYGAGHFYVADTKVKPPDPLKDDAVSCNSLTATLWLQHSDFNTLTSTLSLQHLPINMATSTISLQHFHFNTLTSTLSLQQANTTNIYNTIQYNTIVVQETSLFRLGKWCHFIYKLTPPTSTIQYNTIQYNSSTRNISISPWGKWCHFI